MKRLIFLLVLLCAGSTASAWNARGHCITASIAWQKLNKKDQIKSVDILKHHPEFAEWTKEFTEEYHIEFGDFLFMRASVWPDEIRNGKHPSHEHHHGPWHYVTYELRFDGEDNTNLPEGENVVNCIQWCADSISSKETTVQTKAVYLAWLIHLIGDIHQPLHCASVFNDDFPKGDRGGNRLYVRKKEDGSAYKLHALWDGIYGGGKSKSNIIKDARALQHKYKQKGKAGTAVEWSLESFKYAKEITHLNGELIKMSGITTKKEAPVLPASYIASAKKFSGKRFVQAGYRMAKFISNCYK